MLRFPDPHFDGSDNVHACPLLEKNFWFPEARYFYRIHESSTTSTLTRDRARLAADHRRYLAFVRGLPAPKRASSSPRRA